MSPKMYWKHSMKNRKGLLWLKFNFNVIFTSVSQRIRINPFEICLIFLSFVFECDSHILQADVVLEHNEDQTVDDGGRADAVSDIP